MNMFPMKKKNWKHKIQTIQSLNLQITKNAK